MTKALRDDMTMMELRGMPQDGLLKRYIACRALANVLDDMLAHEKPGYARERLSRAYRRAQKRTGRICTVFGERGLSCNKALDEYTEREQRREETLAGFLK